MTAVGTNRRGQIMFGRYSGGWAQFQPAIGQPANTQLSPPLYRSAIAP